MDAMLTGEILAIALFGGVMIALMLGYPIAFTLPGTALIFALIGWQLGAFDPTYFNSLPLRYWGVVTNEVLIAVPLFVFMGVMLERSQLAESLLNTMGELFGRMRGGLGLSTVFVATLLGASTGIVGATVVTMGLISLPAMLNAKYDPRLASGLICASGSLGQIVPPSTLLVFLAVILQSSYSQAQLAMGNFTPATLSVGDLFAGALIPSLILAGSYAIWVILNAIFRPKSAPALQIHPHGRVGLAKRVVAALLPPLLLIVAVLGSIISGIATPTESASVGAVGAILLTLAKLISEEFTSRQTNDAADELKFRFWLGVFAAYLALAVLTGGMGVLLLTLVLLLAGIATTFSRAPLRKKFVMILTEVCQSSLVITSMVFVIFLGASVFSVVFTRLGGEALATEYLTSMPGGVNGAMLTVMAVMFVLGFFLDPFEIIFVVVPIVSPVLFAMNVDPVWFAVLIGINLQTSYLTPPFGFSLFFLRGVAPDGLTTMDIYRGILPFVVIQLLCIALIWQLPVLTTYLPKLIYG